MKYLVLTVLILYAILTNMGIAAAKTVLVCHLNGTCDIVIIPDGD